MASWKTLSEYDRVICRVQSEQVQSESSVWNAVSFCSKHFNQFWNSKWVPQNTFCSEVKDLQPKF